jgi:hypothetical protein
MFLLASLPTIGKDSLPQLTGSTRGADHRPAAW